jgi:MFS family permease
MNSRSCFNVITHRKDIPSSRRRIYILAAGNAISSYGTYLNMIALNLFAYEVTGSAFLTGLFLAVRLISGLLASFMAASIVLRVGHRAALVVGSLSQAVMLVALATAPAHAEVGVLCAVAVTTGACGAVVQVVLRSGVPRLTGPDGHSRANSLLVGGRSLGMVAGPGSAAWVIAWGGYAAVFLTDATTFVVCAAAAAWLPPRSALVPSDLEPPQSAEPGEVEIAVCRPQHQINTRGRLAPMLIAVICLHAADFFGSSSHNVAIPVYSTLIDPAHPEVFAGRFWTTWAIGSLAVQGFVGRKRLDKVSELPFTISTITMSAAFILAFSNLTPVGTLPSTLLAGAADGFTEVTYVSYLQRAPNAQLERVFGISAAAENIGFAAGTVVCSMLLRRLSPFAVVAVLHSTTIFLALVLMGLLGWYNGSSPAIRRSSVAVAHPCASPRPDSPPTGKEISHGE